MSSQTHIKEVELTDFHGHQSSSLNLNPGLNIIFGKNGVGKTTILHALVNLIERDIERFCYINFKTLSVLCSDDNRILLRREKKGDEVFVNVIINRRLIGSISKKSPFNSAVEVELNEIFPKRPVFLPAYRSVLEGMSQRRRGVKITRDSETQPEFEKIFRQEMHLLQRESEKVRNAYFYRDKAESIAEKTILCRALFGDFVPVVRYPSIHEISEAIEKELHQASFLVTSADEKNLSVVFKKVLEVILSNEKIDSKEDLQTLFDNVRSHVTSLGTEGEGVPPVYNDIAELLKMKSYNFTGTEIHIKGILQVYDEVLATRARIKKEAFQKLEIFRNSLNKFLVNKPMILDIPNPRHAYSRTSNLIFLPDGRKAGFDVLSSGERHVLSLIFAATHMSIGDGLVIIDEPELSLHIDWQRIILGELKEQAGDRQIIAFTHAPEVAADHRDRFSELKPIPPKNSLPDTGDQIELDIEGE